MRNRLLMLVGSDAAAAALAAVLPARVTGQTVPPTQPTRGTSTVSALRRTVDGHPDLTGTYDLAMLTPLERPNGLPAVLSDEEAAKRETEAVQKVVEGDAKIAGDRAAPPKGG